MRTASLMKTSLHVYGRQRRVCLRSLDGVDSTAAVVEAAGTSSPKGTSTIDVDGNGTNDDLTQMTVAQ